MNLLPLLLLLAAVLPGSASPLVTTPAARVHAGVSALQTWYVPKTGLYRTTGWWNAANAITALSDAMRATGSRAEVSVLAHTFQHAQRVVPGAKPSGAPGFLNRYYDDEGWWALAWIDAYDLTGKARYLHMAASIFTDMSGGWDQTCGGGIWWSKDRTYKNAIANELFFSVAAHLAARAGNAASRDRYVQWETREWQWFRSSGMMNSQGLVNDGLTIGAGGACHNNGRTTWTYNQGVIVGALTEAAQTMPATDLLATASSIADAALHHLTGKDGVLYEPCEPHCSGGDVVQFKGIFVRNLQALYEKTHRPRYRAFFVVNADSIWQHDRAAGDRFGLTWSGPPGVPDAGTQASALDALVAAAASR